MTRLPSNATSAVETGGISSLPRNQLIGAVFGTMACLFLAAMSNTIVAGILPAIIAELGGFDRYAWASAAYMVTSTTVMPIAGKLADIYGRRIFFLAGVTILVVASIPLGISNTLEQVILFRAFQGIGGGILMVMSFIAVADLAPAARRGKYHGLLGLVFSLAAVMGPAVGGLIIEYSNWGWAFLINVPLGLLALIAMIRFYPRTPHTSAGPDRPGIDYPGIVTLVIAATSILTALSVAGVYYPWDSWLILGMLACGGVMTVLFFIIESRSPCAVIPLEIYRHRIMFVSATISFLIGFAMFGSILFVPLFFQATQGMSPAQSGLLLTPIIIGMVIGAVLSGQLLSGTEVSYRIHALTATACATTGAALLSTLTDATSIVLAVAYVTVMGAGIGGVITTLNVAVQNTVPYRDVGIATASLQFQRAVGGTVGAALMGAVMTRISSTELLESMPEAMRFLFSESWLQSVNNVTVFLDPSSVVTLTENMSAFGAGAAKHAQDIADYMIAALSDSIRDAFMLATVVTGLSLVCAFFLGKPQLRQD